MSKHTLSDTGEGEKNQKSSFLHQPASGNGILPMHLLPLARMCVDPQEACTLAWMWRWLTRKALLTLVGTLGSSAHSFPEKHGSR